MIRQQQSSDSTVCPLSEQIYHHYPSVCMWCNVSPTQMAFSLGEYLAQGRECGLKSFSSSSQKQKQFMLWNWCVRAPPINLFLPGWSGVFPICKLCPFLFLKTGGWGCTPLTGQFCYMSSANIPLPYRSVPTSYWGELPPD